MELSQVKLIATDMDGTLLNSRKELPTNFYNLFQQLQFFFSNGIFDRVAIHEKRSLVIY